MKVSTRLDQLTKFTHPSVVVPRTTTRTRTSARVHTYTSPRYGCVRVPTVVHARRTTLRAADELSDDVYTSLNSRRGSNLRRRSRRVDFCAPRLAARGAA